MKFNTSIIIICLCLFSSTLERRRKHKNVESIDEETKELIESTELQKEQIDIKEDLVLMGTKSILYEYVLGFLSVFDS